MCCIQRGAVWEGATNVFIGAMVGLSMAFSVAVLNRTPSMQGIFDELPIVHNAPATPASPPASTDELGHLRAPSRLFYDPVPDNVVFKDIPKRFKRSDVEYTYADLMSFGPNRTYQRTRVPFDAPWASEFIFGPSRLPPIFVMNLDKSISRLNGTLNAFKGKARVFRLSAKLHVNVSNGLGLSNIAAIHAMQRHGWPYMPLCEDDASPTAKGWHLMQKIQALVRMMRGMTGFYSLGTTSTGNGGHAGMVPNHLVYTYGGTLATACVIFGRKMIPVNRRYMENHATTWHLQNNPTDLGYIGEAHRDGMGTILPSRQIVYQRGNAHTLFADPNAPDTPDPPNMQGRGAPDSFLMLLCKKVEEGLAAVKLVAEDPFKFWNTTRPGTACIE